MSHEDQQRLWTLQDQQRAASAQASAANAQRTLAEKQTDLIELQTRVYQKLERYLDYKLALPHYATDRV